MATDPVTPAASDQAPAAVAPEPVTTPSPEGTGSEQATPEAAEPALETADTGDPAAVPEEEEQLISQEEFEKLQDDPAALRKALQTSYTQKTQQIAPLRRLGQALQADAKGTIKMIAENLGMTVSEAKAAVEQVVEAGAQPDAPTPQDVLKAALSNALGEEDAEKVLPAMMGLVDAAVAPHKQRLEQDHVAAALADTKAAEAQFTEKYPDWKQYDAAMYELGKHLEPKGLNRIQYLEILYKTVSGDSSVGAEVGKIVDKMKKSAAAGGDVQGGAEPPTPSSLVSTEGKNLTLDEAAAMAVRGERRKD